MKALTRIITITVIGVAVSMMLVIWVLKPVLSDVSTTNTAVKAKKSELVLLEQQILAFKTAQSDLSKATRKDEIANVIQPKENLVAAVKDVEAAAEKTGTTETLDLKQVDIAKEKTPDVIPGKSGINEIKYSVLTLNDFAGTVSFLSYLEHLPHFTEISKIILSAETQESSQKTRVHTGKVIGSFEGVFFVKPTP